MVSTGHLLGFALASLVLIVIPGPWVLFVAGRALAHGRRVGSPPSSPPGSQRDSCITPRAACDLRKLRGKNLIIRPANACCSKRETVNDPQFTKDEEKLMPDAAADQGMSRLAIRADRAFDGREMIPGGALVLCAGGQIAGIEPGTAPAPDGSPVAEFPGATMLPGMIDCHVYLCGDSRDGALDRLAGYSDDELGQVIGAALRAQLRAGVTTVRDLGDRRWAVLDWRQRLATGPARFPSPAIVASGPPITIPGGHCWYKARHGEAEGIRCREDPEEGRRSLRRQGIHRD